MPITMAPAEYANIGKSRTAAMTSLLISHPVMIEHAPPEGHPERPERLKIVERILATPVSMSCCARRRLFGEAQITRAHAEEHYHRISRLPPKRASSSSIPIHGCRPGVLRPPCAAQAPPCALSMPSCAAKRRTPSVPCVLPAIMPRVATRHGLLPVQQRRHRRSSCPRGL